MLQYSKSPLSERVRPRKLDEFFGQKHLVGPKGIIRKTIEAGFVPSMILWGPPGVGKTTLAEIIATSVTAQFYSLSAVSSGLKEVREVIAKAKMHDRTILFIDEIHRFSKSQQDALLGAVERGIITLIGATTENPSFEVINALLSRSQLYTLEPHTEEDLIAMLHHAIKEDVVLQKKDIELKETDALLHLSGGDARKLLNLFELVIMNAGEGKVEVTNELVKSIKVETALAYDKGGEYHYDIISAFIKSIRGSDPNAALYYMARMLKGGEDVKFIARRLTILASEDIGNANPTALIMATNTFQAVSMVGMPESRIILAQCVTYLAASNKSNASYAAIGEAYKLVDQHGDLPVPLHLRNAQTALMKKQGYGKGYEYSHDQPGHFSPQEYLPKEIAGTRIYDPGNNARENELRNNLKTRWKDKYGY